MAELPQFEVLAAAAAAAAVTVIAAASIEGRKKRKRSVWVKPIFQRRQQLGAYNLLMAELRTDDVQLYEGFTRISPENFDFILAAIKEDITASSRFRKPIPADMRLAVTLRCLASRPTHTRDRNGAI